MVIEGWQLNEILKLELLHYIQSKYKDVEEEVVFNKVMNTKRRFRADYMIHDIKVIIEINGGQWIRGRHNRAGKGYENDLTKLNLAQYNDYKIYQFTYEMLKRSEYKKFI
jgi:very-short-patch-repair endonuclease